MMKKELLNKQVVRAISLGLSAVMLTTPMTAMANEATDDTTSDTNSTETEVEQNTVVADTTEAIETAQNTISNSEEGSNVDVVLETPVVLPSTGEEIVIVPDAVEAAGNDDLSDVKTTVGEGEDAEEITYKDVIGEAVESSEDTKESNTGLLGADAELEDAEDALTDVNDFEKEAQNDAAEAEIIIGEINNNNTTVADAATAAQTAADKADKALKEAQAATTEEAAQAAVNKAEEAFKDATAAQTAAQNAYDANVQKLADAEAKLAEAEQALADAKAAEDITVAELAAAHKAVSEAAEDAEALKAQVDADAKALADSEEYALKVAYDNMMAQSVSNRYSGGSAKADDLNGDGIGDEFTTQFGSESASGAYWDAADIYFELYLEYVYKNVYGHEVVKDKCGWTRNNKGILGTPNPDTSYDAEIDNTYTVTYIDENGEEQVAYYNYHTAIEKDVDGDGKNDVERGNITIYEKVIADGVTEAVTEIVSVEKTKEETYKETYYEDEEVTTSEDALSIKSTDADGNVTYIKLDDVKKDTDVVLTTETGEGGMATSVLVKDDNSKLLASDEAELAKNQKLVEGTSKDSYSVETIQIPASYGTKEVEEKWVDCISTYDDLEEEYKELSEAYPEEEGYVIRLYRHYLFGDMDEITWDEAKDAWNQIGSFIFGGADRGYEIGVYKVVEDTSKVTEWADQQVIVKTTTATVETTTQQTKKADRWYDKRSQAENAGHKYAQETLGLKEGEYTVKTYDDDWFFDPDYTFEICYNTTSSSTVEIKSETYSATSYGMNTITTTTLQSVEKEREATRTVTYFEDEERVVKPSVEYKYWKERRNTSNDEEVKAAIDGIEESLADYAAKKDAAAIALAAALQAKADVEKAQLALSELEIDDSAYRTALENLKLAQAGYVKAAEDLEKANQAAEDAEQDYKDAAAGLDRFIPTPSTGGAGAGDADDDDTMGGTTPTTPVVVPVAAPEEIPTAIVTPVAGVGAGAGAAVVDIEDEETPLAAGIGNGNGNGDANGGDGEDVLVAGAEEDETAIVAIEDEETPLAAGPGADGKMSWWWLLIVALFGAAGYKMYKEHQKKKEEAAQEA